MIRPRGAASVLILAALLGCRGGEEGAPGEGAADTAAAAGEAPDTGGGVPDRR